MDVQRPGVQSSWILMHLRQGKKPMQTLGKAVIRCALEKNNASLALPLPLWSKWLRMSLFDWRVC